MELGKLDLSPFFGEADAEVKAWRAKQGYELSGVRWEIDGHWLAEWNKDASKIRADVSWVLKEIDN